MNFNFLISEIYYLLWILLIIFILSLIFIANTEGFKKYELFLYSLIFLGFFSGNLLLIFHTIFFLNSGIILNLDFIFFLLFVGSILWINYVTYKVILKKIILVSIYLPLLIVFVVLQVTLKGENIYKISNCQLQK